MFIRKKNKKFYAIRKKRGLDGKVHEEWFPAATEEEALAFIAKQRTKKGATLEEFVSFYLSNIQVKPKTRDFYHYALQSLLQAVGDITLEELQPVHVQKWLSSLPTDQTRRDYFAAVRTALRRAVAWRLITQSPHEGVVVPKKKPSPGKSITKEEVSLLLKKANPRLRLAIALGAVCGLRISEICGLRHEDITETELSINYQLQRLKKAPPEAVPLSVPIDGKTRLFLVAPKTPTSASKIALPIVISRLIKNTPQSKDRYLTGLLLLQSNGRPFEPSTIRKQFRKLCSSLGIACRLHDLRHTAATLLLEEGVDPLSVSHYLRHADVHTTQTIYQHLTQKTKRQPALILSALFDSRFDAHTTSGQKAGNIYNKKESSAPTNNTEPSRLQLFNWSGRRDSNSRPLVPETSDEKRGKAESDGDVELFLLVGARFFFQLRAPLFSLVSFDRI